MLREHLLHPQDPSSTLNREVLRLENEPGFGKRGKPVIIWANYFQLLVDPRLVLYQYNISIQPQVVGRKRARIIELFLERPESVARSDSICSDFKSTLFSRGLLDVEYTACNIVYRSEFETEPGLRATAYQMRLEHVKTLPVRRLLEFLTTTTLPTAFDEKDALIQAFNVFLNHYAKYQANLVTIGSKTFPKDAVGRDLGGGLTAIRGFFSSVRAATGRILVNVNVCCTEFGAGPTQVQFWLQEQNRYVTVSEFFRRSYDIRLSNERLPVVNVGTKANPIYLPPQVCEVVPGQKAGVKLDAEQTSKMINHAVRRPAPAHNALSIAQEGLAMVGMSRETNPLLDHFHVKVNPNFTTTPARVLPKPGVAYGNKRSATASPGSRRIHLNNEEDPALDTVLRMVAEKGLDLLFIILPAKNTALFSRIKYLCDVKFGVINICSMGTKLVESNGRPQYFGNVGLKLNLKGGGDNRTKSRQERLDFIGDMSKDLLGLWKTVGKHAKFPKNILIYRDGVSHGQYQMVKDHELSLLRKACEETYDPVGQERPRITIVIVTKRTHTRFGPATEATADGNGNCLAGTVTDRGITEAGQWDFWLRYTVADTLEDVTQSLHYVFGRCPRAVSYCAPAYYADIVCERSRVYLSSLFDPSAHSDTASFVSDMEHEDDDRRRSRLQELITPHPRVREKMYYI
ncbi:putative rna interference and silencing protein [Diaporthe ampelina]|uniref:Putative rna interference and silencing protein n=1 Tax=Diaporthe ampelina TaxID=1214573 RepID=A0A0G2H7U8_9PEZI|nr:putative rna interference and silencing protein [Diaporthe ampelina]